jgi:hypothetical protein
VLLLRNQRSEPICHNRLCAVPARFPDLALPRAGSFRFGGRCGHFSLPLTNITNARPPWAFSSFPIRPHVSTAPQASARRSGACSRGASARSSTSVEAPINLVFPSRPLHESWAALITTSPWAAPLVEHCLTQDFPGFGSPDYRPQPGITGTAPAGVTTPLPAPGSTAYNKSRPQQPIAAGSEPAQSRSWPILGAHPTSSTRQP